MLSQALSRPILQNDLTKTSFLLFPLLWNHLPMQWGDALSVCSLGFRPARVLLSQPNQHAWSPQKVFQCHNTLTHFKNTGSMSQCWPCTAGTEQWQRNSSWKNSFVDPQLLRHTFWVQASNNCDYKSLSLLQFSEIKNVMHLARVLSYLYWARKRQWLSICSCFSANTQWKRPAVSSTSFSNTQ